MARPRLVISEYRSYELPADFPIMVLQGEKWRISPVRSSRLHFHNWLEVGVCLSGSGGMMLEDRQVDFGEGTVTFIAPHVLHTTWSAPDTFSLWSYLYLDLETLLGHALLDLPDTRQLHRMTRSGCMLLTAADSPWAAPLVQEMLEEITQAKPGWQTCVRGLLLAFTARMLREYREEERPAGRQLMALTPALEYIRENYMNAFPIERLADLCHMSPTHFRRLFHEQIGTTPLDFVHLVRIEASCTLLRTTGASVAAIASQVGYGSLSCYNRHFLQNMGATPSDWRRAGQGEARHSVLTYTGWQKAETSEEILSRNT